MTIQFHPSRDEFKRLAKTANLIPVFTEVVADAVTPVGLLAANWDANPYCFLLESVEGGESLGRYSIVGFEPDGILESDGRGAVLREPGGRVRQRFGVSALDALAELVRPYRAAPVRGLPRFLGGGVGYLAYETVHRLERLPRTKPDRLGWPDACFLLARDLIVFDNTQQTLKVITCVKVDRGANLDRLYRDAIARVEKNLGRLRKSLAGPPQRRSPARPRDREFVSTMSRPEYASAVRKAKEHIAAGDIIQVVLSRRQEKRTSASPLDIYRALRVVNPSPYMYLIRMKDRAVIGSSPEQLVRLEDGVATTRPIAGTRPRGGTPEKDEALERELLADPKERAEHLMLVDLGRNDLGRVCRPGTVQVPRFMFVERFSHVMHIVSDVRGELKPGMDAFDLLKATFPAGTVSGAPKIRAMEIIDDLEVQQRGPYAGATGYFSYSGNMDMAITIRTMLWDKGRVSVQSGGGIVADSDPTAEYLETENKSKGPKRAVELAEDGRLFWERR